MSSLEALGQIMESKYILRATIALLCASAAFATNADEIVYTWSTVANNGDLILGTDKTFNSYNQPAVNAHGMVVFAHAAAAARASRARIYIRDMDELTPVATVFTRAAQCRSPTMRCTTASSRGSTSSRRCRASTVAPIRSRLAPSRSPSDVHPRGRV